MPHLVVVSAIERYWSDSVGGVAQLLNSSFPITKVIWFHSQDMYMALCLYAMLLAQTSSVETHHGCFTAQLHTALNIDDVTWPTDKA